MRMACDDGERKEPKLLYLLDDGWRHEKRVILDYLYERLPLRVITHDPATHAQLADEKDVRLLNVAPICKHFLYPLVLFFASELDTVVTRRERMLRLQTTGGWVQRMVHPFRELLGRIGLRRYRYEKALRFLYQHSSMYSDLWHAHNVLLFSPVGVLDKRVIFEAQAAGLKIICWVYSWDNPIKDNEFISDLDAYLVWNEGNRSDLVKWHGVDPAKVHVVGAPQLDALIARPPSQPRAGRSRYVLYPCATGRGVFMEQEVDLILWLRNLLDQIDPTVELLVRPYPFRKMSEGNPYDRLEGKVGVRIGHFGSAENGRIMMDAHAEEERYWQIHDAVCMINLGSTIGLEAAYTSTPVLQLAFCDIPEEAGVLSLRSVFENEHLCYLMNAKYPNVVKDSSSLSAALREIFAGRVDPYRAYSKELRRISDPLGGACYKDVLCQTIAGLLKQWDDAN